MILCGFSCDWFVLFQCQVYSHIGRIGEEIFSGDFFEPSLKKLVFMLVFPFVIYLFVSCFRDIYNWIMVFLFSLFVFNGFFSLFLFVGGLLLCPFFFRSREKGMRTKQLFSDLYFNKSGTHLRE